MSGGKSSYTFTSPFLLEANCVLAPSIEEALEGLVSKSLVSVHVHKDELSIHRLVQSVFKDYIGIEQQRQCLSLATNILQRAISGSTGKHSLHKEWTLCKIFMPHILKLSFDTLEK